MAITVQKAILSFTLVAFSLGASAFAAPLNACGKGPLMVGKKQVGVAQYFAENCAMPWQGQDMQIQFAYSENIPQWAFKRAATHFLKRNLDQSKTVDTFNSITDLYRPVKSGDIYQLHYTQASQTLRLSLNQQTLGQLKHPLAQEYFKIWLGPQPFSATLKQQLLK